MPTSDVPVVSQQADTERQDRCDTGEYVVNLQLLWDTIRLRLSREEEGASLVEYALLVALIAVVCIAAIALIGNEASSKLSVTGESIGGTGS